MNSQIYDSGEYGNEVENAAGIADRMIAQMEALRAANAERRRALAEPTHKVVVASPSGMHHKITLGSVWVNEGFRAADANALAGLLSIDANEFAKRFVELSQKRKDLRVCEIIANLIDVDARELAALGLFAEWQRRLAIYLEDRSEWLARDEEFRLKGAWRDAAMSVDQRWLIRVTCRVLDMAMPGHFLRGQAADWLEDRDANLNYRDFV